MATARVITVDVGGLQRLANRLGVVCQTLESDVGIFNECASGVEHGGLRRSINQFEEDWSDIRHQMRQNLETTRQAMVTTATTFAEAEAALVELLDDGGATSSGSGSGPAQTTGTGERHE